MVAPQQLAALVLSKSIRVENVLYAHEDKDITLCTNTFKVNLNPDIVTN